MAAECQTVTGAGGDSQIGKRELPPQDSISCEMTSAVLAALFVNVALSGSLAVTCSGVKLRGVIGAVYEIVLSQVPGQPHSIYPSIEGKGQNPTRENAPSEFGKESNPVIADPRVRSS